MAREAFAEYLEYLKDILQQYEGWSEQERKNLEKDIGVIEKKMQDPNLYLGVIGSFSSGKSTFINAVMGEKILPAYSIPCTAVINEVVYGEDKQAVLYFKEELPMNMDTRSLPPRALQQMKKYQGMKEIPPMEIQVGELEEYVAIPYGKGDPKAALRETPYSKVVVKYPIKLCQDGVELIDSPGLNENGIRTEVTRGYLQQADAILFVMKCDELGSASEMDFIKNEIRTQGYKDIFFVCNAIDKVPEEECSRLKKYAVSKVAPLTSLGEKGVFFVDSYHALNAKENHEWDKLGKTGMPELEASLSEYLRNNRGKTKLMQAIVPSRQFIESLRTEQVESYKLALDGAVAAQKQKLKDAQPSLDMAIQRKKIVEGQIQNAEMDLKDRVARMMRTQYEGLIDKIPEYVKNMDLQNKMTINPFAQKERKEALEQEVLDSLNQFIRSEMNQWSQSTLSPFMDGFMQNLAKDIGTQVEEFYERLDSFRYDATGVKKPRNISAWERLAATAVGTVTMGPAYGLIGTTMGLGSVLKRSALTWGAFIALAATPITASTLGIVMIATAVGGGLVQVATGGKALEDKYKNVLGKNIAKQMCATEEDTIKAYTDGLTKKVAEHLAAIPEAMQNEVEREQSKVNALMDATNESEQERRKKIEKLDEIKENLSQIEERLSKLEQQIQ